MISGSTELLAIVGTPIAQVRSPENFNAGFEAAGADLSMIPVDVEAPGIGHFLDTARSWRNLRGFLVTVPYKQVIAAMLDELSDRAQLLQAVNAVRRLRSGRLAGDIFDGLGFVGAARDHAFVPTGRTALVVGAGGVGSAIAHALCEGGVRRLSVMDVDAARVAALIGRLAPVFPEAEISSGCDGLAGVDLVVNATPVGMGGGDELPLPVALLGSLTADTLVADVVTSPVETPLLLAARERGCRVQVGPEMTQAQLLLLASFFGVST